MNIFSANLTLAPVTSLANVVIYAALPSNRRGLDAALVPMVSTNMAIIGARIILNVRDALRESDDGVMSSSVAGSQFQARRIDVSGEISDFSSGVQEDIPVV